MSISKVLGTTITTLSLAIPNTKAETQVGGAIINSVVPQKISMSTSNIVSDVFESASALGNKKVALTSNGGVVSAPNPGSTDASIYQLQVYGKSSLTNDWTILNLFKLNDDVKDVKKVVNSAPKIGEGVTFDTEITYGDNQKTNVLVSIPDKTYKFFKTSYERMSDNPIHL